MKSVIKKFMILLLTTLLILLTACSNGGTKKGDATDLICGVLLGEVPFIDSETNSGTYINNIPESGTSARPFNASSFVFMDMDQDGKNEAIVYLEGEWEGCNVVLHYNNGVVYGYRFSTRSMQDIFTDGSYLASSGADDSRILKLSFDDDMLIESESNVSLSDLESVSSWLDLSEENISSFMSKRDIDFNKLMENNDILKRELIYENACSLVDSGDYDSAIKILEELDGYADSDRIISAINAMPYISEIERRIISDHYDLSLVGMNIYCEFSPSDYTFTEVWEMTSDGLYGKLSQLLSGLANQAVGYDAAGMSSLAEDMYFDYFYSQGITDIDCAVEVRDHANGVTNGGSFGLGNIPTENLSGYATDEEVAAYANMRAFIIEDFVLRRYEGTNSILDIPDGVTYISEAAFFENENIVEVRLPDSVTGIGMMAFQSCKNLTTISFSNSLEYIGRDAFSDCVSLMELDFPASLLEIGSFAFSGCSNLTELDFPTSLLTIENDAFSGCENITHIEFPDSLKTVGDSAFGGCTSISSVVIPGSLNEISSSLFAKCSALKDVKIQEGITKINDGAFSECESLVSLSLPKSLVSLEMLSIYFDAVADIHYAGTIQEWNSIFTNELTTASWIEFEHKTVHCSDGIWVPKPEDFGDYRDYESQ